MKKTGYNPDTYPWYQCDEEDYNPFDPPDELVSFDQIVIESIALDEAEEEADLAHEQSEAEAYHDLLVLGNDALLSAEDVARMDLYDNA